MDIDNINLESIRNSYEIQSVIYYIHQIISIKKLPDNINSVIFNNFAANMRPWFQINLIKIMLSALSSEIKVSILIMSNNLTVLSAFIKNSKDKLHNYIDFYLFEEYKNNSDYKNK